MMTENDFYPYKVINVFIDQEYLEEFLETLLKEKDKLPKEEQREFNNKFKKHVTILGFRNPIHAPLPLQVNAYASAFEEKDEVIPFTLSTWTALKSNLAEKVKTWLEAQGWKDLSLERQFDENEGFLKEWPDDLTFDELVEKFKEDNPDFEFSRNDFIMMVLWISGKLPNQESII